MLSVSNVEFAVKTLVEAGGFTSPPPGPRDLVLSYLPLCHVAERIFTTWFNAGAGVQVNFAESIATVQPNLREVQPTILFGVPRIWERILASVTIGLRNASWLKRPNTKLWLGVARWIGAALVRTGGRHTAATRLVYAIGWVFFYRALRDRIGMRRVRYAASGAAPIAPEVLQFFMGIGVPMHEVYGMTENTAIATGNRPGRIKLGTVGEPQVGVELTIDPETGEILTRHPGIFVGLLPRPRGHRAGQDRGRLAAHRRCRRVVAGPAGRAGGDSAGSHLRITDRAKDILITAGGKNIAPSEIENALKVVAVHQGGHRHRRPPAVPRRAHRNRAGDGLGLGDPTGHRLHDLPRPAATSPRSSSSCRTSSNDVNTTFATVEQIKKFRMLPKELDHEDGELTATQKVKRSAIAKLFDGLVEDMYGASHEHANERIVA